MSDQKTSNAQDTLRFGPFELSCGAKTLFRDGRRVRIGGRALDILIALAGRSGEVLTKNELLAAAWPYTFVDESNLRVHIAALRKLLSDGLGGAGFLVNVAGRGYIFTAPVVSAGSAHVPAPQQALSRAPPESANPLVGRAPIMATVVAELDRHRLITIVGPGGVGKSALARAVGDAVADRPRRLCFVDLTTIGSADLLPAAVASALDVAVLSRDPVRNLVAFLADQDVLLVLDNCEHVIDAVASLVTELIERATGVQVLATSREPLRISMESVVRLQPLETPAADAILDAATALDYPAVRLFVDRAAKSADSFQFGDDEVPAVTDICRRLDGLPLAIELIAARVDLFGINALATALGERQMLGARGSRSAQPRQQSIRGALDWSHDLLSLPEQMVFRRFSVFRGWFSLESAVAVIADNALPTDDVLDAIALLTAKSLVNTDTGGTRVLYRLLHITRIYAAEKLAESGESACMHRRHAGHFRDLLIGAEAQWETMNRQQWLDVHGYAIDDVRAALDWSFGADGDVEMGAQLITGSLPFTFQLSLIDEFKIRAETALAFFTGDQSPVAQLRLVTALVQFSLNSSSDQAALQALFDRVDALCPIVGESKFKIEPLLARAVYNIERGDHGAALNDVVRLGHSMRQSIHPLGRLAIDRTEAQVNHFTGDFPRSRSIAERVIRHPAKTIPLIYIPATIDRQVTMRIFMARSLWIEGWVDQAIALSAEAMTMAGRDGPLSMTFTLAMGACPIAFWSGDEDLAGRYTDQLLTYGRRYTLGRWERLGDGFASALEHRRATPQTGHARTFTIVEPVSEMQRMLLATIDPRHVTEPLAAKADQDLCGWCNAEILRLRGEHYGQAGGHDADAKAERYFERARAVARQQGALSWELRAATSLAGLWRRQDRVAAAGAMLQATLDRFSEGFQTGELRRASALLDQLQTP